MGQRDDMYNFQRHGVEFDEAYVWVSTESQTTVKTGRGSLDGKNIVFSNKRTSYVNISDYVEAHLSEISNGANHQSDIKVGAHCHSQGSIPQN